MRHHAIPLLCLAALGISAAGLGALAAAPARHPRPLSLSAVVEAPIEALLVAAGAASSTPLWDDSPARLAVRIKTSGCRTDGPYPDPACTPGALLGSSTPAEICVSGYTKRVRNVPTKLKRQVYAEYGIAYPQPAGSYEADHLVPLELGGSNDIANLFPEAAATSTAGLGFKEKDLVENYLHQQVCGGAMPLPRAQEAIARDWAAVYRSLTPGELAALRAQYSSWAEKN